MLWIGIYHLTIDGLRGALATVSLQFVNRLDTAGRLRLQGQGAFADPERWHVTFIGSILMIFIGIDAENENHDCFAVSLFSSVPFI